MAKRVTICLLAFAAIFAAWFRFGDSIRAMAVSAGALPPRTVVQVLQSYGPGAKEFFTPSCNRASVTWPPKRVQLLVFKSEKRMEVWAANKSGSYAHLADFPILAMSGGTGPKRKEGDRQVPEGFYRLTDLNPNSRYHLSIRVNYPNATDTKNAISTKLGGDIFVHGSNVSIGCIAIGNDAIERLFCLVALAEAGERRILIAPCDLRRSSAPRAGDVWINTLYKQLANKLKEFPH